MAKKKRQDGNTPEAFVKAPIGGNDHIPLDEVDKTVIVLMLQRLTLLKTEFDNVNQRLAIYLTRVTEQMGKDPKEWQVNPTGTELVLRPKVKEKIEEKTNA